MLGLIIFNENINYDSLFLKVELTAIPVLIIQNAQDGLLLFEGFLKRLYKAKLEDKFMKGESFMLLWVAENPPSCLFHLRNFTILL